MPNSKVHFVCALFRIMQRMHAITTEYALTCISEMCASMVLLVAHSQLLTILHDKHLAGRSLGTRLSACSSTTFNFTFNYISSNIYVHFGYIHNVCVVVTCVSRINNKDQFDLCNVRFIELRYTYADVHYCSMHGGYQVQLMPTCCKFWNLAPDEENVFTSRSNCSLSP